MQFTGNADILRTMGFTLVTADAVIWLTLTRHYSIKRNQILTTMLAIFGIANTHWQ